METMKYTVVANYKTKYKFIHKEQFKLLSAEDLPEVERSNL